MTWALALLAAVPAPVRATPQPGDAAAPSAVRATPQPADAVVPAGNAAPGPGAGAAALASAHDLRLVGWQGLAGRPAYMPHVQEQPGHRWILYVAHHTGSSGAGAGAARVPNGTSILDVTDPARPALLAHLPGDAPPNDEARSVRACTFPNGKTYLLRSLGQVRYEVFETTDPARPVLRATIGGAYTYTHKINWECETGLAYLPVGNASGADPGSGVARWKRGAHRLEVWRVLDDGAGLRVGFVRSFGLPGMLAASPLPAPTNVHHAIVDRERKRLHVAYGCCGDGIYQIVDRARLLDPAHLDDVEYPSLGVFPQGGETGVHTAYPLNGFHLPGPEGAPALARDLVILVGEAIGNECAAPQQSVRIFDVTAVTQRPPSSTARPSTGASSTAPPDPTLLSRWSLPAGSLPGSRAACSAPGWFGPHSTNESYVAPFYGKLVAVAYFGGGVRVLDIRDPLHPREVAHAVPAAVPGSGAIQTNNAEVDARGYVYVVDRWGSGLHVLELTGEARRILDASGDRPVR